MEALGAVTGSPGYFIRFVGRIQKASQVLDLTGTFRIAIKAVCDHQRGKFSFLASTHKQIDRVRSLVLRRGLFARRRSQETEIARWTAKRMKYPGSGPVWPTSLPPQRTEPAWPEKGPGESAGSLSAGTSWVQVMFGGIGAKPKIAIDKRWVRRLGCGRHDAKAVPGTPRPQATTHWARGRRTTRR